MTKITKNIKVGTQEFGQKLFLIAGPCVAENLELCLKITEDTKKICERLGIDYIFKASYDKANRSSVESERGPGLEEGLEILESVKERTGVPVLSDIHTIEEVSASAGILDVLQIPAFLCRQTDLLIAAAKSGKPVNVKKGQFLAPWDMNNVISKLKHGGTEDIFLTERGSSFGYNNLVTDMRSIAYMSNLGYPVLIDATHSVQLPGGNGSSSSGERRYVETIALSGIAAGANGLFLEIHPEPEKAPCDSENMLPVSELETLLVKALKIYESVS